MDHPIVTVALKEFYKEQGSPFQSACWTAKEHLHHNVSSDQLQELTDWHADAENKIHTLLI